MKITRQTRKKFDQYHSIFCFGTNFIYIMYIIIFRLHAIAKRKLRSSGGQHKEGVKYAFLCLNLELYSHFSQLFERFINFSLIAEARKVCSSATPLDK